MNGNTEGFRDGILVISAIALLIALMRMASDILVPILLSLFIAIIAVTPLGWLKKQGLGTSLSIIIVITTITLVLALLALLLGDTIARFNDVLPGYQSRLEEIKNSVASSLGIDATNVSGPGILNTFDLPAVLNFANNMVTGIGIAASNIMLIIFTVIFILIDAASFPRKMEKIRDEHAERFLQSLSEIANSVNQYVVAKSIVSLINGLLIWASLALIGLDFAPLWGFLAFLLNFVPNIGSVIAAVPAVLVALLQLDPTMALIVIAIFVFIDIGVGDVIEPLFMSQSIGLSTLSVFISLLFWGWMFGPVGMLLSVPLTMVVKLAAQSDARTRWISFLLSPAPRETGK